MTIKQFTRYCIFCVSMQFFLSVSAQDTQIAYGNNPKAGKYLLTRGVKFYYEIYGSGEPLLLIHGNGGSIASFQNQIPYFAKEYKVIAVDSRAQGKSTDVCDSLSFEMMADDFSVLLDSLHESNCRVLGWSDGGINVLLLAIRHPEKVKMLASTGANIVPDSTAISAALLKEFAEEYLREHQKTPTPQTRNACKLMALDLYQPHISTNELKQIKCPSLIIGGDKDLILPSHTLAIAQAIPGAFLWIVPDSGHATLLQHKKQFNEIVSAFFKNELHNK